MNEHARRELEPPAVRLKHGDRWAGVRRVQEWLCLHGNHTAVDGDFGPATEAAITEFQWSDALPDAEGDDDGYDEGECDLVTWTNLVEPMRRLADWNPRPTIDTGQAITDCARAHLNAHPREVGGPNGGPWVRYYCRGQEVPWCAGFVGTVLEQALGHDEWYTLSCDELAAKAAGRGVFLRMGLMAAHPGPGDVFLIRPVEGRNDWTHCGIITAVGDGYFETIEGNTNTNGAREGTAVHARVRAFGPNVDFVLMGGSR